MPGLTNINWDLLTERLRDDELVAFLGAGASLAPADQAGLPTAAQLSERLADACGYPEDDRWDLFKVAQYYEIINDARRLRATIKRIFDEVRPQPTVVHRMLASLPIRYVCTTNFDCLMEEAFRAEEKEPRVMAYNRLAHPDQVTRQPLVTVKKPVVCKLHGDIASKDLPSLVITEDDVIDFLARLVAKDPPLNELIASMFTEGTLLFIGYGLRDWNIRTMLRALRGPGAGDIKSFAVQRRPLAQGAADTWEKGIMLYQRQYGITCFDVDAAEFCTQLKAEYEKRYG